MTLALGGTGVTGWIGLSNKVAAQGKEIELQADHNKERYEDLKAGQRQIRNLLEQMLRDEANRNGRDYDED